jgi:hypothetical protein
MIGPQAYENLFQTKPPKMETVCLRLNGRRYSYAYDWEILSMYESMTEFKQWCLEDVMERDGMYADSIEVEE